ncbi:MAG: hypothetical protein PHX83_03970 [Acidobacteriia bacterium]|nr:hypothetical protein [Terriglobia bacterium]
MAKQWKVVLIAVTLLTATAYQVWAQETAAPPVLRIEREEIKPGTGSQHEREANGYVNLSTKMKSKYHWVGMEAVTGDENSALFFMGFGTFADMEKNQGEFAAANSGSLKAEAERLDREGGLIHTRQTALVGVLRPDLSYHLEGITLKTMAQVRFFNVVTFRTRPGSDQRFAAGARIYYAALEKAHITRPLAMYQVIAGAPNGTYIIIEGYHSLGDMDAVDRPAIMQALGADNLKKLDEIEHTDFISTESNLYAVNPAMSYAPKEVVSESPDFWNPKPAAKPRTAAKEKKEPQKNQ